MQKTAIERAFELARAGHVETVEDIKRRLHAEGADYKAIQGPMLIKQLRGLIRDARSNPPESLVDERA